MAAAVLDSCYLEVDMRLCKGLVNAVMGFVGRVSGLVHPGVAGGRRELVLPCIIDVRILGKKQVGAHNMEKLVHTAPVV